MTINIDTCNDELNKCCTIKNKQHYDFDKHDLLKKKNHQDDHTNIINENIDKFKSEILSIFDTWSNDEIYESIQNFLCEYNKNKSVFSKIFQKTYDGLLKIDSNISKCLQLVQKIDKSNEKLCIIILNKYYSSLDIENLYKDDYLLLKTLYNKYNNVKLENLSIKSIKDDNDEKIILSSISDDIYCKNVDNIIFYQSETIKFSGDIINVESIFHNHKYYFEYDKVITCIIINK